MSDVLVLLGRAGERGRDEMGMGRGRSMTRGCRQELILEPLESLSGFGSGLRGQLVLWVSGVVT